MSFKKNGKKYESDKMDIEESINRGIKLFNEMNEEEIPLINKYNYGIQYLRYSFEEEFINISWEKDEGRCGEIYMEEYEKNIPYEYFESTNEEKEIQNKIEEDKRKRDNLKSKINGITNEINSFRKELKEHENELRDIKRITKKYSMNSYMGYSDNIEKKIDKEIIKIKGALYIKEEELEKLNKELKG